MKLVTFRNDAGELRPGVLVDDGVVDLHASDGALPNSIRGILAEGLLDRVAEVAGSSSAVRVQEAELVAPIPDPGKIACIGLNYRDHAVETGADIPTEPIVFSKFSECVIAPGASICLPAASDEVDYEAELVVVIGRQAKNVDEASAMDYVAGYTLGNDISARDWQKGKPGGGNGCWANQPPRRRQARRAATPQHHYEKSPIS